MTGSRSKKKFMLVGIALLAVATLAVAGPMHQMLDHNYKSIWSRVYTSDYRYLFDHKIGGHFF